MSGFRRVSAQISIIIIGGVGGRRWALVTGAAFDRCLVKPFSLQYLPSTSNDIAKHTRVTMSDPTISRPDLIRDAVTFLRDPKVSRIATMASN